MHTLEEDSIDVEVFAMRQRLLLPHKHDLLRSGLSEETIAASEIYSANRDTVTGLLGYEAPCGGIVIPYLNAEEPYARVKLDYPGRGGSYRAPKGSTNHLYLPPMLPAGVLEDTSQPLWITEGEKKALKACQEGLACVAVSGVYSWRTKQGPIQDLDDILWAGRTVTIVFDSDAAHNAQVLQAEKDLARELASRGAIVFSIRLPSEGAKVGLDDYLMRYTKDDFMTLPAGQIAPRILAAGLGQFLKCEFPKPTPIIKDILVSEGSGFIGGEEKLGKSLYALEEALCLALGVPVCERFEVPERQRVLFIEEEDSPQRMKTRIDALLRGHGYDPNDAALTAELDEWFHLAVWSGFSFDDEEMVLNLKQTVVTFQPKVVYLDALRRLTSRDITPQHEASRLTHCLDDLRREHGCLFRVLHHYRKASGFGRKKGSQELSGSFVFGAWAETSLFFEPIGKQSGVARLQVQTKDGLPPEPFKLVIESEGPNEYPTVIRLRAQELAEDKKQDLKDRVYELIGSLPKTPAKVGRAGVSIKTISEALQVKPDNKSVRNGIKDLEEDKRIVPVGTGDKGAKLYDYS
jgi:hypothetical protein